MLSAPILTLSHNTDTNFDVVLSEANLTSMLMCRQDWRGWVYSGPLLSRRCLWPSLPSTSAETAKPKVNNVSSRASAVEPSVLAAQQDDDAHQALASSWQHLQPSALLANPAPHEGLPLPAVPSEDLETPYVAVDHQSFDLEGHDSAGASVSAGSSSHGHIKPCGDMALQSSSKCISQPQMMTRAMAVAEPVDTASKTISQVSHICARSPCCESRSCSQVSAVQYLSCQTLLCQL